MWGSHLIIIKPQLAQMHRTVDCRVTVSVATSTHIPIPRREHRGRGAGKSVRTRGLSWAICSESISYKWQGIYTQELSIILLPKQNLKMTAPIGMPIQTGEISLGFTPRRTTGNWWLLKEEESIFSRDAPPGRLANTKRSSLNTDEQY